MVQLFSKMATYLLLSDKRVLAVINSETTFSDVKIEPVNYYKHAKEGTKSWIMVTQIKMAYDVPMFDDLCIIGCLLLISSVIANLDMSISKHVCFLFTVCITQNINQNRLTLHYITPHNLKS